MTINPTLPPTVAEFHAMFPEFKLATDEQVELYLDIGMLWIDDFWFMPDAKIAVMYAAAHYLYLQNKAGGGAVLEDSSVVGSGGGDDPEIGKIWVKSVRFRDRMVSYARVGATNQRDQSGGGEKSSAAKDFWNSSPYGQMLLSFRRKNVPHVAVI